MVARLGGRSTDQACCACRINTVSRSGNARGTHGTRRSDTANG